MRYFSQVGLLFPALSVALLCVTAAFSQDWTADQKEVWKNEEAYWLHRAQGNVQEYLALLHEDFAGWPSWAAMPVDKPAVRKFIEEEIKSTKILFYDIRPTAIRVFGNTGIVYYYISMTRRVDGREQSVSSRYMHVWLKQGPAWKMVGGDSVPNSR
jgi:ketosteroid isomerase-like protein